MQAEAEAEAGCVEGGISQVAEPKFLRKLRPWLAFEGGQVPEVPREGSRVESNRGDEVTGLGACLPGSVS